MYTNKGKNKKRIDGDYMILNCGYDASCNCIAIIAFVENYQKMQLIHLRLLLECGYDEHPSLGFKLWMQTINVVMVMVIVITDIAIVMICIATFAVSNFYIFAT